MTDPEQATINSISQKMDKATGAFIATGAIGGILLLLVSGIFLYAFNKLEVHDAKLSNHETRISVNENRLDLLEKTSFKK